LKILDISFGVFSLLLGILAILSCIFLPFGIWYKFLWWLRVIELGLRPWVQWWDVTLIPHLFNITIWNLFFLLCFCFIFSIFSFSQSVRKFSDFGSRRVFYFIGLFFSTFIILYTCFLAFYFLIVSAYGSIPSWYELSFVFYSSLIYGGIIFLFSLTQLILSFKKNAILDKS